jgi:hypothetical protein
MKNIILLVAILLTLVSSCTKTGYKPLPTPPEAFINFSKADLEYVLIPHDRYFIYKDSATGNLDSVTVAQNDLTVSSSDAVPFWNLPATHFQMYTLDLEINKDSETLWYRGVANSSYGTSSPFVSDSAAKIRFSAQDNLIAYPALDYGFSSETSSSVSNQHQSSLTVESNIYNDVVVCTCTSPGLDATDPGNFKSTYYWAKGVGIIKRTVETNSTITTSVLERYGY